jgi:hypothetical protein
MFDKRYPGAAARLAETLTVRPLVPISVTATLGVPPLQAPKRSAGWTCPPG